MTARPARPEPSADCARRRPVTASVPGRQRCHAAYQRSPFVRSLCVIGQQCPYICTQRLGRRDRRLTRQYKLGIDSGESDRLLRIASDVSLRAARAVASRDLENAAYDVAACINAARLVPGDAESAQRSTLLAQAAQALAWIADTPVDHIVPPRAALAALQQKLEPAGEPVTAGAGTPAQWRELARQANHEVQQLVQVMVRIDATEVEQEHVAVHGMAARIGLLSEIVFLAAALHGESREDWDTPAFREVQALFHGGTRRC